MTQVTILSDNEVGDSRPKGLRAEWGFAADVGGVLFDTGQTGIAADNADELDEIVAWIAERVERIAPTHCTGHDARRKLEGAFGEDYERVGVGSTVEL